MKNSSELVWPDDVDGDVFRSMQASGFDLVNAMDIDFNVDFSAWPPAEDFMSSLRANFPRVEMFPPEEDFNGYVGFVVHAVLTYDLVMFVQASVSELALPYGGVCNSWGTLQLPDSDNRFQ